MRCFVLVHGAAVLPQEDDFLSAGPKISVAPRWEQTAARRNELETTRSQETVFPDLHHRRVPKIKSFGESLPFDKQPDIPNDKTVAWPIRTDRSLGNWRVSPPTLQSYLAKGYVKLGGYDESRKTWTVLYLGRKTQKQIETGVITIAARDTRTGAVQLGILAESEDKPRQYGIALLTIRATTARRCCGIS